MLKKVNEQGFTLIEVFLVIGILGLLFTLSIPYYESIISDKDLSGTSLTLLKTIRQAQTLSMNGSNGEIFSVHIDTVSIPHRYILFEGDVYNPADPDNEVTELPNRITISNVSLNGGGNDVIFEEFTGNTSQYGTITLSSDSGETEVIRINQLGMTDV